MFQNLGDGTYNHSGYMAIRASIASGVNITYKILFNDAVAMTGGQMHDGGLTVPQIAAQVAAEGAKRVVVVSDEPKKYPPGTEWPEGITFHHRDDLQAVQKELAEIPGCTVLIYDQTCAAEKRRRRKRGTFPDPDKRVIINELVCEGCGDCGVKSNCVSVQPLETEFGRKRTIDQSSCNKDYSCVKGFCPSFVTVHGAKLKKGSGADLDAPTCRRCPSPMLPKIDQTYNIIVTGVGGTGIVTIGGILGMAAHLEGKGVGVIDMAGLAQKGGAVYSHMRIAERPEDIHAIRVAAGGADLVLGGDIVVAGNKKVLAAVQARQDRDGGQHSPNSCPATSPATPTSRCRPSGSSARSRTRPAPSSTHFIDANRLATALFGSSLGANIFLVGYAYQLGALPLSADGDRAGDRAQRRSGDDESRGVPLGPPRRARSGRRSRRWRSPRRASTTTAGCRSRSRRWSTRRVEFLTAYQNAALCGALPRAGGEGEGGGGGQGARASAASPKRSRAICSS